MKQLDVNYAIWMLGSAIQNLTRVVESEKSEEWKQAAINNIENALDVIKFNIK